MHSYCTININDEEIGLKFGLFAMRQIIEKVDLTKVGTNYSEMDYANIIFAGYMNNVLVKELPVRFNFEDFVDYVELCSINKKLDGIVKAYITFAESRAVTMTLSNKKKEVQKTPAKPKRNSRK